MGIKIGDAVLMLGVDKSEFDHSMNQVKEHVHMSMKQIQASTLAVGAAFTTIGIAGMKFISDARQLNAQLGQTAFTLGVTTKDMRDLALATTDVTFPLKSVSATFDLLARAGVRSTDEMQKSAKAFDALADATGSSAEAMADLLLPAYKLFGRELPTTSQDLDKFTWLVKNTLVDMSDFGTLLTRMSPYMNDLNMSMDDAIATLAALGEQGITGTAATLKLRTAITQAASSGEDLSTILGITQEEIDKYKQKMADATGITDKYAVIANEQYTIVDKLKQKFNELSVSVGSAIRPLEGIFGAMSAVGPGMISVSMLLPKLAAGFRALPAIFYAIGAAATTMWGAITLGVSLAITAGIALWQNWDKVKDFLEGLWINMKIIFAEGVKFIVNTVLLPFIEFWGKYIGIIITGVSKIAGIFNKDLGEAIENVGQKFLNARQELTAWADNLAAGARVEKSIRETERSLRDVGEALVDTNEIIDQNAEGTNALTTALKENRAELELQEEQLKKQKDAYEKLSESVEKTRKQFEYERSEAGKLRITIKDVTFALFELGWTNEQVTDTLSKLGDESDNVNAILEAVGLTAQQVSDALQKQTASVDKLTSAYKKASTAAAEMAEINPYAAITGAMPTGDYAAYLKNMMAKLEAEFAQGREGAWVTWRGEHGEEREGVASEVYGRMRTLLAKIQGYQYGGPIIEPTLLYGLRSLKPYAVAHEGERVTPSQGQQMLTVVIEMDGRQLAKKIMPYAVGEIRLNTGVKI